MASEETFNENEEMHAGEAEMNEAAGAEEVVNGTGEAAVDPTEEDAVTEEAPEDNTISEEDPEGNAASEESKEEDTDSGETAGEQEDPEAEQAEDKEPEEESDKVGLFGGKKLKKELEKKLEQISELTDRNMRLMAEFDNYRKRTEKEKAAMYGMGAKDVVEKILPVIDNFERGFSLVAEEDMEDPFTQGMEKIYKQFLTVLEGLGVTPIEAVGKEFDPNYHNAVMHVDDENYGENIVVEEFQKGYLYKDSVVRHSMVKVAN